MAPDALERQGQTPKGRTPATSRREVDKDRSEREPNGTCDAGEKDEEQKNPATTVGWEKKTMRKKNPERPALRARGLRT